VAPGVVIVVATWMLDPVACAGMQMGVPHVSATALTDLHRLLIERGFRRSSQDDSHIVLEERDDQTAIAGPGPGPGAGVGSTEHRVRLDPIARVRSFRVSKGGRSSRRPSDADHQHHSVQENSDDER
jgi:hypothetical protein